MKVLSPEDVYHPPMTPPERPPRLSRSRRAGIVLATFVVLVAAAAQFTATGLRSRTFADIVRQAAIHWGSQALGADLMVEQLRFVTLHPLRIELIGVTLHSRDSAQACMPLVFVDRVEAALSDDLDLRDGHVPIEFLIIDRPSIRVAADGGRYRDFQALIDRIISRPPSKRPWAVELAQLSVLSARVRLSVDPVGLGAAISGVDLSLEQDSEGEGGGRFGASSVELVWAELRERATVESGTFQIHDRKITLDEHRLQLRTGPLSVRGDITLPPPPGSSAPPGLRLDLRADTTVAMAAVRGISQRLPEAEGQVTVSVHAFGEAVRPQVNFQVVGRGVQMPLGKNRKYLKPGDFDLQGYVLSDLLKLTPSVAHWGGGEIGLAGRATLRAPFDFELFLDLDDVQLERVLDAVMVPHSFVSFTARGPARIVGQLKDFAATGNADIAVRDLVVRAGAWDADTEKKEILRVPTVSVSTRLVIGKDHLLLDNARITGPNSRLVASSDFLFRRPLGLVIQAEGAQIDLRDVKGRIAGLLMEGVGPASARIVGPVNDLDIAGHVDLAGFSFLKWPLGRLAGGIHWHGHEDLEFLALRGRRGETDYAGQVRVLFPDLKRGGERAETEIEVDVEVAEGAGRAEDLHTIFFGDVVPITGPVWGQARLSGPPGGLSGAGEVHGRDLSLAGESFASMDAEAQIERGRIVLRHGFLRKPSGDGIFLRGSIDRGEVDSEFRLTGMGLSELDAVPDEWAGRIQGDLVVRGELRSPTVRGRLAVLGLGYRGTDLGNGSLSLALDDKKVVAEGELLGGRIQTRGDLLLDGIWPYDFDLSWKDLLLDPFLPPSFSKLPERVTAATTGALEGEGTLRDGWHELRLGLAQLGVRYGPRAVSNPEGEPIRLRLADGAWNVDQLRLTDGGATDLQVAGRARLGGPLQLRAKGPVDLEWLHLLGDAWERVEAKSARIEDLELSGTASHPDWSGAVEVDGGLFRLRAFPETLEIDHARLSLRNRRATIEALEGRMGGGRVHSAAGSTLVFDEGRWTPQDWRIQARCTGCTVHYPTFLPPARGDLSLTFGGNPREGLVLGGQVYVEEMTLRDPINWQRSVLTFRARATEDLVRAEKAPLFGFDLYISTSPDALRVSNNLGDFRGGASDLHLGGDTNRPHLIGQIDVAGGTVRYNRHDFRLEPGTAIFRSEVDFLPEVLLSMNTDLQSAGESYRVTYRMTGPLDRMRFTATSEPDLQEKDINSLLLFGLTEEQLAQADLGDIAKAAASAGAGTYAGSIAAAGEGGSQSAARVLAPDRVEIVPVYSDTTGSTSVWAVFTKEVLPDLLTLEGGVGLFGSRTTRVNWVSRAKLRFTRGVFLEGSWQRDDNTSSDFGNFSLDLKLELERP